MANILCPKCGCQIAVDDALDGLRVEVPPLP